MKKTLLALALMSVATTAAADSLVYGGVQVGSAEYDIASKTEDSTVYGAHIGTGILPFIGIEGGIWNLGSYSVGAQEVDVTSVYAALKPSIDFGPLHVYGKAGIHRWAADYKGFTKSSDDDFDAYYGAGIEYSVIPMLTLGLGYNNFAVGDENVDFFSLNATIHFL
ncbi:MAG: porin family protein [Aliivibrio sp.]|uniref:outer membrane beta-barrel protein n=1 Tax=Aliivibrio sp. TaxID=1872443 RepID=UPI001A5DF0D9|nr:porin family protein [Aliivibrio sp.]